jgi:hypothetical protein
MQNFNNSDLLNMALIAFMVITILYFLLKEKPEMLPPSEIAMRNDFQDLKEEIEKFATPENADFYWIRIGNFADYHRRFIEENIVCGYVKKLSLYLTRVESTHPAYS